MTVNTNQTGSVEFEAPAVICSDRVARAFVWAVWFFMTLIALVFLVMYGRIFPLTEDWLLVPTLTGNEPNVVHWLWEQVNEHRVPFPKLVLVFLLKVTHGDFRVGMIFNILTLSLLSVAMIYVARHIRGGQSSFVDGFFPVTLLHLGHAEILLWSWEATVLIPTVAACVILLVIVADRTLMTPVATVVAGISLVLLPLSGLNGVIYAPFLAVWLGSRALLNWRDVATKQGVRWTAIFLLLSAILALLLTGLYFVGYQRPSWAPHPSGLDVWIQTTLKFLAVGLGPIATSSWSLSVTAVVGLLVSTAVVGVLGVLRHQGHERQRALGILLFLGTAMVFALGIGWGRAAAIPLFGVWPLRYSLFAVPAICTAFYAWELYGSSVLRKGVQVALFVIMCLLLPLNTTRGLYWIGWFQERDKQLMHDFFSGTPPLVLADRYKKVLYHSVDSSLIADRMRMLKGAGYEPFSQMAEDASKHEDLKPIVPPLKAHPRVPLVQSVTKGPLVTQEIRHTLPEADEVYMIWGLNGWSVAPEELRPAGTELRPAGPKQAELMHTPMIRQGDVFITKVSVPAGTTIDYGFLIMKIRGVFDTTHPVWDGGYQVSPSQDGVTETKHSITEMSALLKLFHDLSDIFDARFYFWAGIGSFLITWLSIFFFLPLIE